MPHRAVKLLECDDSSSLSFDKLLTVLDALNSGVGLSGNSLSREKESGDESPHSKIGVPVQ